MINSSSRENFEDFPYAGQVKKLWNFDKEADRRIGLLQIPKKLSAAIDLVIDLNPFVLLDPKLLLKDGKKTLKLILVSKKVRRLKSKLYWAQK